MLSGKQNKLALMCLLITLPPETIPTTFCYVIALSVNSHHTGAHTHEGVKATQVILKYKGVYINSGLDYWNGGQDSFHFSFYYYHVTSSHLPSVFTHSMYICTLYYKYLGLWYA